jgi:hypothetical protein
MTSVDVLYVLASMTQPIQDMTGDDLIRQHRSQGYSRAAVHYVIERSGRVQLTRPIDEPGFLAGSADRHAIQVCLIGGVSEALAPDNNFTPEQREALRALIETHGLPVRFDRACPLKEI